MEDTNTSVIRGFADNGLLVAAVKGIIMKHFSMDDTKQLYGLDDKSIGEVVRAKLEGRAKVEEAFKDILRYKTVEKKLVTFNPAR